MNMKKLLECEREIITKVIIHRGQKYTKLKKKYQDDMDRLFAILKKVTERINELEKGDGKEDGCNTGI